MNLPRFGVRNPVPINLLMAGLILAGIYSAFTLRRQFFPDMQFDTVVVSMAYPGASPSDVESTIAQRLENAIMEERKYLENAIKEKDEYLQAALRDKDEYLGDALKAKDDVIRDMENSFSFRIMRKLDKLLGRKYKNK